MTDRAALLLSDFLSVVTGYTDELSALSGASERIAAALDADAAAVVDTTGVRASTGFPGGAVPPESLQQSPLGHSVATDLPGLGGCHLLACTLEGSPASRVVVARSAGPFEVEERLLLQSMARILSLGLRPLRRLSIEQRLRVASEEQSHENQRLLDIVEARRTFLERLIAVQRAISTRQPIDRVFMEVAQSVAATLGDRIVVLRLLEPGGTLRAVSTTGLDSPLPDLRGRARGLVGEVLEAGDIVVVDDYPAYDRRRPDAVSQGVCAAMGAPVRRDGVLAGVLVVASTAERSYAAEDRRVLDAFAEQVSIALNDQSAADARRLAYEDALHRAHHDALTGLANRRLASTKLAEVLQDRDRPVSVMFIDIDRFKAINDSWGHDVGDDVLRQVATHLTEVAGPQDLVARLSGDEFLLICPGIDSVRARVRATEIADALRQPRVAAGHHLIVTVSVGITEAQLDDTAETLLRDADVAMYRAKQSGRARVELFDRQMQVELRARSEMEQALRRAVADDELQLRYQPIIDITSGALSGMEALLRWARPGYGLQMPAAFLDVAEETGLIAEIGTWVLKTACRDLAGKRRLEGMSRLTVNVNVAAMQMMQDETADMVAAILRTNDLPPDALRLELTESVLMEEADAVERNLRELRRLGVDVSIDDFGTGYSSLLYLKRFQISELKIDRRFVSGLGRSAEDGAIVDAILGLARALGVRTIAEGVETPGHLRALRQRDVTLAQGYLFGRPSHLAAIDSPSNARARASLDAIGARRR